MNSDCISSKPDAKSATRKGWLLFALALLSFPAWFGAMWWNANERSGWNDLVAHFGSAPNEAVYPNKRAVIGLIHPNDRRHVFADHRSGGNYHRGKVDYGYDETGFWMRGRFRGFTYGPARSLFIPWSEVQQRDDLMRIHLRNYPLRFYVQEQALLDAAARYAR